MHNRSTPKSRRFRISFLVLLATCAGPLGAQAAEPFRFSEARQPPAELKYIEGLPVLVAAGMPEEMGSQIGTLTRPALRSLVAREDDLARGFGLAGLKPLLLATAKAMAAHLPADTRTEMEATAKAAGIDPDLVLLGNIMYDYSQIGGCSVLMVEPSRSADGNLLFGRNLDFPTFGFIDRFSLVIVYRPKGKHAFVSVTFPGLAGCVSGMNDAGLALAQLEVRQTRDDSPRFDPAGVPMAICFRRLLEECSTVDEAEKLLREMPRTTMCNLAIADRQHAAVLEITTRHVVRRAAEQGLCACTNHFRTPELAGYPTHCERYAILDPAKQPEKLGFAEVARKLDAVNQGELTLQTMIFEPQRLRMHLSLGPSPASSRPLKELDLGPLFSGK